MMYPRTPWDIVGEAWRRHCNLAQVSGVKLPIGDYIWVQGHVAAADGSEDTPAPQDVSSNRVFGACLERKTVNDLGSHSARGDHMSEILNMCPQSLQVL